MLRSYLQNLKQAPSGLPELEQHAAGAVKKLHKAMKRCKRKLGSLLNETSEQLKGSACNVLDPPLTPQGFPGRRRRHTAAALVA